MEGRERKKKEAGKVGGEEMRYWLERVTENSRNAATSQEEAGCVATSSARVEAFRSQSHLQSRRPPFFYKVILFAFIIDLSVCLITPEEPFAQKYFKSINLSEWCHKGSQLF